MRCPSLLRALRRRVVPIFLLAGFGCVSAVDPEEGPYIPDPKTFVPVSGVITLDGKPLETAVVTFLPSGPGLPGNAETGPDGKYRIETMETAGAAPGEYKVAVSYLLSAEGVPQGLGPRSAMAQPPGMLSAREHLKETFADLGRTTLRATVGPQGGTFDFAVERAPEVGSTPAPKSASAKPEPVKSAAPGEGPAPAPAPKGQPQ